jgi:predicted Zn-dependent protease
MIFAARARIWADSLKEDRPLPVEAESMKRGPVSNGCHAAGGRLAVVVLMAMAGCAVNPSTGRTQLLLVSREQVNQMGKDSMPELIASYGGEIQSATIRSYVSGVGGSMADLTEADNPDLEWEFVVLDSDVINAFALPGGKVFISRGLLVRLDDEAQMAGVLGHEIGHVTARHIDERISHSAAVELGVSILGAATESELAELGSELFGQGYLLNFNRGQELEADDQGLKYMSRAGYAPAAMLGVMEVLAEAAGGEAPPELLSTHPHPETRLEAIREALDGPYRHTLNNPQYGRYPGRFRREVLSRLDAAAGPASGPLTLVSGPAWCGICRSEAHGADSALIHP